MRDAKRRRFQVHMRRFYRKTIIGWEFFFVCGEMGDGRRETGWGDRRWGDRRWGVAERETGDGATGDGEMGRWGDRRWGDRRWGDGRWEIGRGDDREVEPYAEGGSAASHRGEACLAGVAPYISSPVDRPKRSTGEEVLGRVGPARQSLAAMQCSKLPRGAATRRPGKNLAAMQCSKLPRGAATRRPGKTSAQCNAASCAAAATRRPGKTPAQIDTASCPDSATPNLRWLS
jgi:hypothetical protein